MQITNYFDIRFILNLSVSITISLFIVLILGKAVTDTLSEVVKFFLKNSGKTFLKRISPPKFLIGFSLDRIRADKFAYERHKTVNFGKLNQASLPAYGVDLFIKTESKLPFLYVGSKVRVQLVDSKDLLGAYNVQKLPNKPTTIILGEIIFENKIVCHIHLDFKPEKIFENYKMPINIFCQGKLYHDEISLTVKAE
jgi:hypothetical protein